MANDVSLQSATLASIAATTKLATFQLGTSSAHLGVDSLGGQGTTAIAAGVATDTVIKAAGGYLAGVMVTTQGTNAMVIYDNASAGSGKIIGVVAANAPAGPPFFYHMPAANGITVLGNANNPAVTISWA
jgi:hypothetical protein